MVLGADERAWSHYSSCSSPIAAVRQLSTDGGMQSSMQCCINSDLPAFTQQDWLQRPWVWRQCVALYIKKATMLCMPACVQYCIHMCMWTSSSTVPGLSWMMDPLCCWAVLRLQLPNVALIAQDAPPHLTHTKLQTGIQKSHPGEFTAGECGQLDPIRRLRAKRRSDSHTLPSLRCF